MTHVTRRGFGSLAFGTAVVAWMAPFARSAAAQVTTKVSKAGNRMERRRMGSMDASLTGLGLAQLGSDNDYAHAERIIHTALDHGINFFDSGQIYGDVKAVKVGPESDISKYVSEEFLGRALASSKRRKEVYIATKCGFDDVAKPMKQIGFKDLETQCDKSLKKLQTDYIDMYQLHRTVDANTPMEEVFGQMNRLVEKGKVRNIGTTLLGGDPKVLREHDAIARKVGKARFVGVQSGLNLLQRNAVTNLLPILEEINVGLIPIGPLANGFLTGKYRPNEAPPPDSSAAKNPAYWERRLADEKNFKIILALEAWSKDHGHTLLDLAFAYIAGQKAVTSIIAGASKPEQVIQNAKATEWKLTPAQVAEVTKVAAQFDASQLKTEN